jgi:hypothetical protein
MTEEPDDPADFTLVRPYVPGAVDPPEHGRHRQGSVPSWARPTQRMPRHAVGSDDVEPIPIQTPQILPIENPPMSKRTRIALAATAALVLVGSAVAVYATMGFSGSPLTGGAPPTPARLPAIVPGAPSPSVASTTDHTTKSAVAPAPPSASPSVSASARSTTSPGTGTGTPSSPPSPSAPVSAPASPSGDLAYGKSAVALGGEDDGSVPVPDLVDGDPNTYWQSSGQGSLRHRAQTLRVDLGASTSIDRIVLRLPPQSSWTTRTETMTITGGTGGSGFQTLAGTAGYTFDPATGNTVTITFAATDVRYVEFDITANTGSGLAQLSEIEIFAF